MTDEKLLEANRIKHELKDVEAQMEIISETEARHLHVKVYSEIGCITLDLETGDTVCGIVLNHLTARAEELKRKFDEL